MTTDGSPPPPSRLLWIAKANILLGIVSLVRFVPELVMLLPRMGENNRYFALLALDLLIAGAWLKSGLALRKHRRGALGFAVIAGAVIFAHAAASGYFVGVRMVKDLEVVRHSPNFLMFLSVTLSRLLVYAAEFFYWPFGLSILTKLAGTDESDPEHRPSERRSVILAMVAALLIGGVVQSFYLSTLMNLR